MITKNYFFYVLAIAGLFVLLTSEIQYSTGSPGGKSGSPGDGGATCTDCHGGTATFQAGWITSTIPSEGYVAGETYTVTATGTHNGVSKFGFEATAEDGSNQKTGSIIVTNNTENQLANGGTSITHKSAGTVPNGNIKSWSFDWTAPAAGTGPVTFYSAFNAANGNGNTSGDVIYTSSLLVPEASGGGQASISVQFSDMNPHIGQLFEARLIDKSTLMEMERTAIDEITGADFNIEFSNVEEGKSYWVDFYADHNDNGYYDGIPTDHAWRLTANEVAGTAELIFTHNTNFNEIQFKHMYTLEFEGMTPHVGQLLEVRLVNQGTGLEAGRVTMDAIPSAEFDIFLPFLVSGENYLVDFYADLNGNGVYDAPPADHAWRIELDDVEGDEDDNFIHNISFTDIGWNYRFTLNAMNMNPHLGQLFEMRIVNQSTLLETGRMRLDSLVLPDFSVMASGLELGSDYYVDFYADHNGNGVYDPPPADHAWRLDLMDVTGDSQLDFTHNTNFTDIQWPVTGISENRYESLIQLYPNPVEDRINIDLAGLEVDVTEASILDLSGSLQSIAEVSSRVENLVIRVDELHTGIYFLVVQLKNGERVTKRFIKR